MFEIRQLDYIYYALGYLTVVGYYFPGATFNQPFPSTTNI